MKTVKNDKILKERLTPWSKGLVPITYPDGSIVFTTGYFATYSSRLYRLDNETTIAIIPDPMRTGKFWLGDCPFMPLNPSTCFLDNGDGIFKCSFFWGLFEFWESFTEENLPAKNNLSDEEYFDQIIAIYYPATIHQSLNLARSLTFPFSSGNNLIVFHPSMGLPERVIQAQ